MQHDLGVNGLGKDKGRQIPLGLGKHELRNNGAEGNRSRKRYRNTNVDTVRGVTSLSTLERRT